MNENIMNGENIMIKSCKDCTHYDPSDGICCFKGYDTPIHIIDVYDICVHWDWEDESYE